MCEEGESDEGERFDEVVMENVLLKEAMTIYV
jgi:hypothetical protein